jgi:hypothetical protein
MMQRSGGQLCRKIEENGLLIRVAFRGLSVILIALPFLRLIGFVPHGTDQLHKLKKASPQLKMKSDFLLCSLDSPFNKRD